MKDVKAAQTKALYKEVFHEDQESFVEYYYKYKLQENKIFQIEDENQTIAMIHLNPFILNIGSGNTKAIEKIYYIVAVATQEQYRHQGKMDELLKKSIYYLIEQGSSFTFLMPADAKIYQPYQFTYIYDRVEYQVNSKQIEQGEFTYRVIEEQDWNALVDFCEQEYQMKYHVYIKKDISYFKRLQQELISQDGNIYIICDKIKIIGYTFVTKYQDKEWIQEATIAETYQQYGMITETEHKKPIIMARIISLQKIIKGLRLKEENATSIAIMISIIDPLISTNDGIFYWEIDKQGSKISLCENKKPELTATIETMTSFLFGYETVKECFGDIDGTLKNKLQKIQVLENVIINESV